MRYEYEYKHRTSTPHIRCDMMRPTCTVKITQNRSSIDKHSTKHLCYLYSGSEVVATPFPLGFALFFSKPNPFIYIHVKTWRPLMLKCLRETEQTRTIEASNQSIR